MNGDAARDSDDVPPPMPTLYWVAAYLMHRVFGGHEEGGWCAPLWREKGVRLMT